MPQVKKASKRSKKEIVLTPAQKAWQTIRAKYSADEITSIFQNAAAKAAETRKRNLEIAAAEAAKKTRKTRAKAKKAA